MRRLLAIGFIWLCCAAAWNVLGATITTRTGAASGELGREVQALWGPPLVQAPPSAVGVETHRAREREQRFDEKAKRYYEVERETEVTTERALVLESSDVDVRLALEHRRKGLLWFPTYGVELHGRYAFRNDSRELRRVTVTFPLGPEGVTYDGFHLAAEDGQPLEVAFDEAPASPGVPAHQRARFTRVLGPGERLGLLAHYRARGTERWSYGTPGAGLGPEKGRARDFRLTVAADFPAVDFPAGSLSPSEHGRDGRGWKGTWRFEQIVGTKEIGIVLPEKLNPGPLAARITFFAPVSLLFFFFVTGMLLAARGRSIHPMNYFLLACAFFAFHLLLAYLIDHVQVGWAFAASALVAVALVATYARLFVGWRSALLEFALPQTVYLVLFSVSFFWTGFTGLAITVGAVATLFVVMQLTGRVEWEKLRRQRDLATMAGEVG